MPTIEASTRWTNGALFKIADRGRKRAGPQHQGEVRGLLFGKAASDAPLFADRLLDIRHFAHTVVEHYAQAAVDIRAGEVVEAAACLASKNEGDVGPLVLVDRGLRVAEVRTGYFSETFDDPVLFAAAVG